MKNTFTPGEWEIGKHATPDYAPQFGIYAGAAARDHVIVKGEHAEADARLIAAAPELLAALQAIDAYEDDRPAAGTRERELWDIRRAAIAKATQ